jgi:hypothetical protein
MSATEHTTQNAIIRYLAMHDGVRVFRQNTGRATIRGSLVTFGTPGQGDLRCIISPEGWLVEIEVKSPTGRQAPNQHKYEAMLTSLGALYILARCVEDVWRALRDRFPHIQWLTPGDADLSRRH